MANPSRRSPPARRSGGGSASRRTAAGRGRSAPAGRQPTRRNQASRARHGPRFGWSRRLGVALAVLLVGAGIVFAGQAIDGLGDGPRGPVASPLGLPPAPRLAEPLQPYVADARIDVEVELPTSLPARRDHRLRVYVNGAMAREVRLPAGGVASVEDVPLERGANQIAAAIAGPGGESLHSAPIVVTRDDEPPTVHVSAPDTGRPIFTEHVTLRGRTEAGALVQLRNDATGEEHELEADGEGHFAVRLALAMGRNQVSLRSRDMAGNRARASVRIERVRSDASVTLEVLPAELLLDDLPTSLRLVSRLRGLRGEPIDGASVTFSLSVPGQGTLTYTAVSANGVARWEGVRVPREGARDGAGLATVFVVLTDEQGEEVTLQESASLRFR